MGKTSCRGQKSGIRRQAPTPCELMELRKVLQMVAPKAADEVISLAEEQLLQRINAFRQTYPYAVVSNDPSEERLSKNKIRETRALLDRLNTALQECVSALDALPANLEAMRLFCSRSGPLGASKKLLGQRAAAAREAFVFASKALDKPPNWAPAGLAMGVALIVRDVLGLEVTLGTDRRGAVAPRGGAAYARLLRAAMSTAGANPPNDLLSIMQQGKGMLDQADID